MDNNKESCYEVNDDISVSVLPSKDGEGNDILIIPEGDEKAQSVRSTTELVNKLKKDYGVENKELIKLLEFVSARLRELNH